MKKIQEKLNSNKGSSLILVLMLFLVCIMVSSVVVTMATVGASRSAYRTEQQRAYLSMSSAVDLVAEDMEILLQNTFSEIIREVRYQCDDEEKKLADGEAFLPNDIEVEGKTYEKTPAHKDEWGYYEFKISGATGGILGNVLAAACQKICLGDSYYEEEFVIKPATGDERVPEVHCKFVMYGNYSIAIVFSANGTKQTMTMEFDASMSENEPKVTESGSCKHYIIYEGSEVVINKPYPWEVITYSRDVEWSSPKVKRGAE